MPEKTVAVILCGAFPGSSDSKESACNMGDLGSIPELGRYPGRGHGNPLQYSCLENPHGQQSLVGYNPWDCKEWNITEQLSTHTQLSILYVVVYILKKEMATHSSLFFPGKSHGQRRLTAYSPWDRKELGVVSDF